MVGRRVTQMSQGLWADGVRVFHVLHFFIFLCELEAGVAGFHDVPVEG